MVFHTYALPRDGRSLRLVVPTVFPAATSEEELLEFCRKQDVWSMDIIIGAGVPAACRSVVELPFVMGYEARKHDGLCAARKDWSLLGCAYYSPEDRYFEQPLGMNPPPNPWEHLKEAGQNHARFWAKQGFMSRFYLQEGYSSEKKLECTVTPEEMRNQAVVRLPLFPLML